MRKNKIFLNESRINSIIRNVIKENVFSQIGSGIKGLGNYAKQRVGDEMAGACNAYGNATFQQKQKDAIQQIGKILTSFGINDNNLFNQISTLISNAVRQQTQNPFNKQQQQQQQSPTGQQQQNDDESDYDGELDYDEETTQTNYPSQTNQQNQTNWQNQIC